MSRRQVSDPTLTVENDCAGQPNVSLETRIYGKEDRQPRGAKQTRVSSSHPPNEVHEWTRVVREIRSLRGNAKCSKNRIRPSSQGSWECPKHILVMYQGKLNDKD